MQYMKTHVLNLAFYLFFLVLQCCGVNQNESKDEDIAVTKKTIVEKMENFPLTVLFS